MAFKITNPTNVTNIPYCYLIGWSWLDIWYYGRRTAENCHPNEFWISYFTSSDVVTSFRSTFGEPDIIQIRRTFTDPDYHIRVHKCAAWEDKVLERIGAVKSDRWLNNHNGGKKFNVTGLVLVEDSIGNRFYISKFHPAYLDGTFKFHLTGKSTGPLPEEHRQAVSKWAKQKRWWNNGTIQTQAIRCPGPEFVLGRIDGFKFTGSKNSNASAVRTPIGVFSTVQEACQALGLSSRQGLYYRMQTRPFDYWYV